MLLGVRLRAGFGLNALLPAAMHEEPLLRSKAQRALVPFPIAQNPKFLE